MRIDAHHHLWQYNEREFGWIGEEAAALRRDFLPAEFDSVLASSHVDAAIAVQARCAIEETRWLLECAAQSPRIAGVVGWVPLHSRDLPSVLDEFTGNPCFVGVREIAQGQPSGFLLDSAFNGGVRELTQRDLTYDVLIHATQLGEAIRFVDLHPKQQFVLDHAAKPPIAAGQTEPWRSTIQQLAQRSNVMCKLSGLVTEAHWQRWTERDLQPYLDTCLEAFGPGRCMAGSDWPVCLVATSYAQWWQVLERWAERLSVHEQQQIFGETAAAFYRPHFKSLKAAAEVTL